MFKAQKTNLGAYFSVAVKGHDDRTKRREQKGRSEEVEEVVSVVSGGPLTSAASRLAAQPQHGSLGQGSCRMVSHQDGTHEVGFWPWEAGPERPAGKCLLLPDWLTT